MRALDQVVGGSRAAVLRALQGGPLSVGEIVNKTGLSQPNVSNHLGRLRENGIVAFHRHGRHLFYEVTNPELIRTLLALPTDTDLSPKEVADALATLAQQFGDAVLATNEKEARLLVSRALAQGLPWQGLYAGVFEPLLVRIEALVQCGALSVSEERAAALIVDRILNHVAALRVPAPDGSPVDIVVACVEGEHRRIRARMLSDFLAADGRNVVFLGADVPSAALIVYAVRYQPKALCVCATTADREAAVRDLARRLQNLPPGVHAPRFVIGGPIVQALPALAAECGAEEALPALDAATAFVTAMEEKQGHPA